MLFLLTASVLAHNLNHKGKYNVPAVTALPAVAPVHPPATPCPETAAPVPAHPPSTPCPETAAPVHATPCPETPTPVPADLGYGETAAPILNGAIHVAAGLVSSVALVVFLL